MENLIDHMYKTKGMKIKEIAFTPINYTRWACFAYNDSIDIEVTMYIDRHDESKYSYVVNYINADKKSFHISEKAAIKKIENYIKSLQVV